MNYNLINLIENYRKVKSLDLEETKIFYTKRKDTLLLVMLSCLSIDYIGKKNSHQKRITSKSLINAGNCLIEHI